MLLRFNPLRMGRYCSFHLFWFHAMSLVQRTALSMLVGTGASCQQDVTQLTRLHVLQPGHASAGIEPAPPVMGMLSSRSYVCGSHVKAGAYPSGDVGPAVMTT